MRRGSSGGAPAAPGQGTEGQGLPGTGGTNALLTEPRRLSRRGLRVNLAPLPAFGHLAFSLPAPRGR